LAMSMRQPRVIITSRGFHEANRDANVQFGLPAADGKPAVDGNKVSSQSKTGIPFFDELGLGPVEAGSVITVEGNRIKTLIFYFPLTAADRIDQGCREHPTVTMFGRPCSEFAAKVKAHTAHLIAEGIIGRE